MKANKLLVKIANQAVEASFVKGSLDQKKVTSFLTQFKKLDHAQAIVVFKTFHKGLKRKLSEQTLVIESASPLSTTEINQIKSRFSKDFSLSSVESQVTPSLLGGVKVKIGDNVFDLSVSKRIEQLRGVINGK